MVEHLVCTDQPFSWILLFNVLPGALFTKPVPLVEFGVMLSELTFVYLGFEEKLQTYFFTSPTYLAHPEAYLLLLNLTA